MEENENVNESKSANGTPIKSQSVKRNFGYQAIYQIIVLVIPFIVEPFLTRWLGSEALGEYNYASSYVSYFVMFSGLGISQYGVRLMASRKNDSQKLRHAFWSLYLTHFFVAFIATIAYFFFALFFPKTNAFYLIGIITVIATLFDTTWLFTGLENFRRVVICNLIVKLITTTLVFIFIRDPGDIYLYAFIGAGGLVLSNLLLVPFVVKNIKPIKVTARECLSHVKPLLTLFVGVIAISVYTVFNKTLLGLYGMINEVAFYNYADKIINIVKTVLMVIITVTFPRVCALVEEGKEDEAKGYVNVSIELVTLLGMGAMAGILALGEEFATLYFGEAFAASGVMLMWMSALPYLVGMNNIRVSLFMIPYHKDRTLTLTYIFASVLNIGTSLLFINIMGANGVIVGTLVAEATNYIVLSIFSRKLVSWRRSLLTLIPYAAFGVVMYFVTFFIKKVWTDSIFQLITLVMGSLVLYLLCSGLYLLFFSDQKEKFRTFLARFFKRKPKNGNSTK